MDGVRQARIFVNNYSVVVSDLACTQVWSFMEVVRDIVGVQGQLSFQGHVGIPADSTELLSSFGIQDGSSVVVDV